MVGISSAQLDQSAAELIADIKKRGANPQGFREAQNAFGDFRDKECAALSGGNASAFPSTEEGLECWIELTHQRRAFLEKYWLKRAD
jgi:uncharacterized protein YecT (DUF1311 family)